MSQETLPLSFTPAQPTAPVAPKTERSFVSHARLISALTLLSRILGMMRESVVAKYFGAGVVSSAFTFAFKVPNLFRKLLGEGALASAFIPLYAQSLKTDEASDANRFAAASVNLVTTILIALTLIGEAVLLALILSIDFSPANLLTIKLTAIMLPYVLLICLTAFLSGILQVHKRFGLPAFSPVLLNVIHIAVMIIGARLLLSHSPKNAPLQPLQIRLAYWLAAFVLVAGVLQVAMLLPALSAVGFRFTFNFDFFTPRIKKMLRLSGPVALSAGVLQISVLLDLGITMLLTRGETRPDFHLFGHLFHYPMAIGAVARLNWAQQLYQFPLGVFAISVATAIFPGLGAAAMDTNRDKFRAILRHGITLTLWEGFAASAGLIIVRYPAIRLLFERGSFTAEDTRLVALSVIFYSSAIWAFSLQQILNRAYYAMHDTKTPLLLSIITIAINTLVEIPLAFTHLGESAMAAGTLASFAIQAIVMITLLDRKVGGLGLTKIAASAAKMLIACAVMAAACWAVQRAPIYPHGAGHLASLLQLIVLMGAGGAAYMGACRALKLKLASH